MRRLQQYVTALGLAHGGVHRMRIKQVKWAAVALLIAAGAAQSDVTVNGVKYDDTVDLRGAKVQLNGAGTRYKAVFKVYTAGLYLPKKVGTPEEALAQPGAKRITVTMLRDIDSGELGKLFARGME